MDTTLFPKEKYFSEEYSELPESLSPHCPIPWGALPVPPKKQINLFNPKQHFSQIHNPYLTELFSFKEKSFSVNLLIFLYFFTNKSGLKRDLFKNSTAALKDFIFEIPTERNEWTRKIIGDISSSSKRDFDSLKNTNATIEEKL